MSPESWAGLSFLKLRRKLETGLDQMELYGLSILFLPAWWYCLLNLLLRTTQHCKLVLLSENLPRILNSDDNLLLRSRCLGGLCCSTVMNTLMTTGARIQLLEESGTVSIPNTGIPSYCFGNMLHHLCHGGDFTQV